MYTNFDFRSHGQICICAEFAYMQIEICTWSQPGENFAYVCKLEEFVYGANFAYVCKSIHKDRFAHVSIFAYMQIFAHVCKSCESTFNKSTSYTWLYTFADLSSVNTLPCDCGMFEYDGLLISLQCGAYTGIALPNPIGKCEITVPQHCGGGGGAILRSKSPKPWHLSPAMTSLSPASGPTALSN